MDTKKIKYTVSWTEHPKDWNIPGTIRLLEAVRKQVIDQENKRLEEFSSKETQALIERLKCQK